MRTLRQNIQTHLLTDLLALPCLKMIAHVRMCVAHTPAKSSYHVACNNMHVAPHESHRITRRTAMKLTAAGVVAGTGATTGAAGAAHVDATISIDMEQTGRIGTSIMFRKVASFRLQPLLQLSAQPRTLRLKHDSRTTALKVR